MVEGSDAEQRNTISIGLSIQGTGAPLTPLALRRAALVQPSSPTGSSQDESSSDSPEDDKVGVLATKQLPGYKICSDGGSRTCPVISLLLSLAIDPNGREVVPDDVAQRIIQILKETRTTPKRPGRQVEPWARW